MRWLALLLSLCAYADAATLEIHYAPSENLEAIDVATLENAAVSIDMAAYVLSYAAVVEALGDAADRGVAVRLYLDRAEYEAHAGALMHLKAYAVDRARLRTGSGKFSRSGLSAQDNDLLVTDDAPAVARFERDFELIFAAGAPAAGS